ncbi:MAG: LamG domain-containing protein [Kiritimatiellae bacterium]|nr:LamG domain-containing protein [Kiritimatiellia bacterium]
MTRRVPVLVAIALVGLLGALPARAQWTSAYTYVNLAADFNGYETLNPNMQLISNGVWQAYVTFQNHANDKAFLFATPNFAQTWKWSGSQSQFNVPLSTTLQTGGGGNDIVIKNYTTGTLKFTLNESTRAFSVVDVTPGSVYSDLWINELHYDDPGTDTNEFIEVAGAAGTALSAYKLILYNGNDGKKYNELTLSGTIPNQVGGYGAAYFAYGKDGIQNGAPDGIALVKSSTNVLSFISYEGTVLAVDGPAQGMTSVDIGVQENNSGQPQTSLQLTGPGAAYADFTWIGPTNWSRGLLNEGQSIQVGTPAAALSFSNLTIAPAVPTSDDPVHVLVNFSAINNPSNVRVTTFYRVNEAGRFLPLPMSVVSGNVYKTINPIPAQGGGSTIEYYIFASFSGMGMNSPIVYPATAPSNVPSYRISSVQGGNVWINEIRPYILLDIYSPPREYLEIAGVAGSDISKWTVELFSLPDSPPNNVFQIPDGTVLGNEGQGFGFYVLGNASVPGADFTWPDESALFSTPGGVRLLNEFGDLVSALQWGDIGNPQPHWSGFTFIGDMDAFFGENTLGVAGTGGTVNAFAWTDTYGPTPGERNTNQVFTGGNTNVLPPMISCPSNIYLSCLTDPIPAPNTNLVSASSLCGGAVNVSWVSDVTNGTGCAGNPRIITRTYKAVAPNCGKTNTCEQLIIIEDKTPPVIEGCDAATLANAGFEVGNFSGWQPYGGAATNISIDSAQPYSGFRHARVRGSSVSAMTDESGNELEGFYVGNPLRRQAGAKPNTAYSVRFNGTNQYAEVSNNSLLNGDSFSFAFWVKPLQSNNTTRALLTSRQFTISEVSGYHVQLTTSNKIEFWTANGFQWDILQGAALSTNWTFVAGTLDYSSPPQAIKRLWVNGVLVTNRTVTNFMANTTRPLRIAAGATEANPSSFFGGYMDDIRIFSEDISTDGVAALWNSGNGRTNALGSESAYYRMDEASVTNVVSLSGLQQSLSASTGQARAASAWVMIPASDPLMGSNKVYIKLDYLNATNGVLATHTSQVLNADTAVGSYYRLIARGSSPANTHAARISAVFQQDAAGSSGTAYIDDAVLSTLLLTASNSCPVMPDLLWMVSATDTCSAVSIAQYPTSGTLLSATNSFVRFTAVDACGNVSVCERELTIVDDTLPTIACPVPITVDCLGSVPSPNPALVLAQDNCGAASVSFVGDVSSGGDGCGTNAHYIVREYRATDLAGNTTNCFQLITVSATNPPVVTCTLPSPLNNRGFEDFLAFYQWTKFGTTLGTTNASPHSGSRHARLWGPGGVGDHYTGFYQDMQTQSGQLFRGSAWVMFPTNAVMASSNSIEMKIEFLSPFGLLTTHPTLITSSNLTAGSYKQFAVSGVAPVGATVARLTFVYLQRGNASGVVYVDDVNLSLTELSVTNDGCTAILPDYRGFASASGCDISSVSQSPPPGSTVGLGVTPVTLTAYNQCDVPGFCVINVTSVNDGCTGGTPPPPDDVVVVGMSLAAGGVTVRSIGTNTWSVGAEYTTNLAAQPQTWLPVNSVTNIFNNGTNITTFQPPVTGNTPVIYRIWQKYP